MSEVREYSHFEGLYVKPLNIINIINTMIDNSYFVYM